MPAKYSDDLHRAIRWMLQTDSAKRPAVEELEKLPRLKPGLDRAAGVLGLRAPAPVPAPAGTAGCGRTASAHGSAKEKEEELAQREAECARREAEVARREAEVARREAAAVDWDRSLREREVALSARTAEFQHQRGAAVAAMGGTGGYHHAAAAGSHAHAQAFARPLTAAGHGAHAAAPPPVPALRRPGSAGDVLSSQQQPGGALPAPLPRRAAAEPPIAAPLPRRAAADTPSTAALAAALPLSDGASIPTVSVVIQGGSSGPALSPGAAMDLASPPAMPLQPKAVSTNSANVAAFVATGKQLGFGAPTQPHELAARPSSRGGV